MQESDQFFNQLFWGLVCSVLSFLSWMLLRVVRSVVFSKTNKWGQPASCSLRTAAGCSRGAYNQLNIETLSKNSILYICSVEVSHTKIFIWYLYTFIEHTCVYIEYRLHEFWHSPTPCIGCCSLGAVLGKEPFPQSNCGLAGWPQT